MNQITLLALCVTALIQLVPTKAGILDFGSKCGDAKSHNFNYGVRKPYDRLLYMDHVNYPSKLMRVRSVELSYPVKGQAAMGTISYIEVVDARSDGTGGCVYISNGGIGQPFVTLKIKSQRNHGMEFFIRIYGN